MTLSALLASSSGGVKSRTKAWRSRWCKGPGAWRARQAATASIKREGRSSPSADIAGDERFLHGVAFKLPGVTPVRPSVVLKDVKAEIRLPITPVTAPGAAVAAPLPRRRSAV